MIDLTMDMEQYDCPFIDTSDDYGVTYSAVHWDFDRSAEELETRLVVEGEDRNELEHGLQALREHDNMHGCSLLSKRDNVAHIRTVIGQTEAMEAIRNHDGYITGPFYIEDGHELWHVGFDHEDVANGALSELEWKNEFDVVSRETPDLPDLQNLVQNAGAAMTLIDGCRDLSDVERDELEHAVRDGYFQSPRSATLGTLADEFGVSKPAVSKNLRRGQRKMIQRVVDALELLD
ncbi:DNA-binding protein [Haladaptatus sp. R4]|uniref:helix-turn-helix domain-containing protein n=1 Tax=Haladaptatus sp. R4 TaxID=1679489 RepID=UPI0007B4CB83|nr:helix-turn-helix domain-containing protein [Haladaptatus sp. R4]KZN22480.1 DNA-binding protein [Haladaptatus sp. R4]